MLGTTLARSSAKHPRVVLGMGFALGLLVGVGMLIGAWATMSFDQPKSPLFETALHAMATDTGKNFSIATGSIADGVEGIFCLDFLTGELQCWVLNNRTNSIGAYFTYNVSQDLMGKEGKNPEYLMVTGLAGLRGGGSDVRPSDCVVYVADGNTGNIAGYAVPWSQGLASRGNVQQMKMLPIFKQRARNLQIRGQ
ncbi:MAG: hypothetical protein R6U98_32565 [Pirellulaceae bacterium]